MLLICIFTFDLDPSKVHGQDCAHVDCYYLEKVDRHDKYWHHVKSSNGFGYLIYI